MYRVVYFSGFVKTDLSVPERKLGEAYGSPKILFHRKMRPMNFISHQTIHTFSRGSTQGQMISGFLVAGAAQRTALVMTF